MPYPVTMFPWRWLVSPLLAIVTSTSINAAEVDAIRIGDLPTAPEASTSLPAVDRVSPDWTVIKPIFAETRGERSWKAWAGASSEALHVRAEVVDPEHNRSFRERHLWRGDAMFIGVDGLGDSAGVDLSGPLPIDDLSLIIGLGSDGPDAYVDRSGNPDVDATSAKRMVRSIVRDDTRNITIYEAAIPWAALRVKPGASDNVGIAFCFKDAVISEDEDLDWGNIRSVSKPRQFHRFMLPGPVGRIADLVMPKTRFAESGDVVSATLIYRDEAQVTARLTVGNASKRFTVPGSSQIRRIGIHIPVAMLDPDDGRIAWSIERDGVEIAGGFQRILTPSVLHHALQRLLGGLAASAEHPLAVEHLRNTAAVLEEAYRHLAIPGDRPRGANPRSQYVDTAAYLLTKLEAEGFDWSRHLRQARPLIQTFISSRDSSLQYFTVQLPYGWDPQVRYPMFVYLHGAGNPLPLGGLQNGWDPRWQDTYYREVDIDPNAIPATHRGFVVAPWARANSGYREYAEDDVWQSLSMAEQKFRIDPERRYLTGFSMGGIGTWTLASRSPDHWAAISCASGFLEEASPASIANLRGLPIQFWCGEDDTRFLRNMRQLVPRLDGHPKPFQVITVPGMPHAYPYSAYAENVAWLLKHTRAPRPDAFAFIAEDRRHAGIYGIEMVLPQSIGGELLPRFNCRIADGVVTIDSQGDLGVDVRLGVGGLGLSGRIRVIWNGRTIHDGNVGEALIKGRPEAPR